MHPDKSIQAILGLLRRGALLRGRDHLPLQWLLLGINVLILPILLLRELAFIQGTILG
jgi:hypothetical protein